MQFLIDTATDSAEELYKIGRFLVDQFETVPVPSPEANPEPGPLCSDAAQSIADANTARAAAILAPPPSPPAIPLETMQSEEDADLDVELDEAQNVTAVTVSTELPAHPGTFVPDPQAPTQSAAPIDSAGVAWSAALHTSTKSKTIDGRWKPRKPRDPPAPPPPPVVTAAVTEAQNTPGNVPSTATGPAPAVSAPAANVSTQVPPPPPAPPSPGVPSAAIGSAAPSMGIATTPLDFRGLMQKIQKATADGKLTADQVNAALAGVGLKPEEMAQLINNAPLIASVNAAIDSCLS